MKYRTLYLTLLSGMLITGCGGGSGGDSKSSSSLTPKPIQPSSQSTIALDRNIDNATRDKIVEIVSPFGSTSATGGILPTINEHSVVMALDKDGQIVMLGAASGNSQTTLNAESTAIGLVRLLWGQATELTDIQIDTHIKATTGFADLLGKVTESLNIGTLVSTNEAVLQQTIVVANQLSKRINAKAQARYLPTSPSVSTPLPFSLISLSGITIDQNFKVVNNTPIAWETCSRDHNLKPIQCSVNKTGTAIQNTSTTQEGVILPAASLSNRFSSILNLSDWKVLDILKDTYFKQQSVVAVNEGVTFEYQVLQSDQTRLANNAELMVDMVLAIVPSQSASSQCKARLTSALMDATNVRQALVSKNVDQYVNSFQVGVPEVINAFKTKTDVLIDCFGNTESLAKSLAANSKLLNSGYLAYKTLNVTYDAATLVERLYFITTHMTTNNIYTVCVGRDKKISNCAEDFTIVQDNFIMIAGDSYKPTLKAFDKGGKETLLPPKDTLEIASTLNLLGTDESTIYAIAAGKGDITIKDITTGKTNKNKQWVEVIEPVFKDKEVTLDIDKTLTLSLVDEEDRVIKLYGNERIFEFSTDKPDIVDVIPDSSNPLKVKVTAKAGGEAYVIATNKKTSKQVMVLIKVDECGMATNPIIHHVKAVCDSENYGWDVSFEDERGIEIIGSYYGIPNNITYPVQLWFKPSSVSNYEIAANGYRPSLLNGTNKKGTLRLQLCSRGSYNYNWKVAIRNSCGKVVETAPFPEDSSCIKRYESGNC